MTDNVKRVWDFAVATNLVCISFMIVEFLLNIFGLISGTGWTFFLASGVAFGSLAIALAMTVASIFRP